jgi:tripartite-type tricarboxylate transporter receptor subunit TctC
MKIARSLLAAVTTLALSVAATAGAAAQDAYPSRPVTAIVPFAAGGPTDGLARIVAQSLTQKLGQQVLIENVPGAGGTIGSGRVARADADGYTLLVGHAGTLAANVGLYKKLPYSSVDDFEPIGFMGDVPQILLVEKDLPVQTAAEFFAYAKEHQDEINCGTAGVGSAAHLGGLLLNAALGTKMELVSYKGAGPAMNDLMGGQIDCMVDVTTTAVPQIKAGTVRPLAVLRAQRIAVVPDVPTTAEVGLQNMEANIWNVLLAPKGTPQPVLDRLATALRATMQNPAVQERLAQLGVELPSQTQATPAEIRAYIQAEVDRWLPVIKAAGVSAD